jgi:lipopolysaccharide export system permease protein
VPTLWRYIGARFLFSFLASLGILALVVLVVDMLLNVDEVLEAQKTAAGAAWFLVMRTTALYLPYLIPAAAFTGVFMSVGLAARTNEVVAMKAGGIAPLRALVPVLVISVVIALLSFVLGETVSVRAAAALNQKGADESDISLSEGTIWYHAGRFIYNIRDPDPDSESVRDIRVFERDDAGRLVRLIQARSAMRLGANRWRFEDATVRRFDPAHPTVPPTAERAAELELTLDADRSLRRIQAELPGLPLPTVASYVASVLEDGGNPRRARAHMHERLTRPLLVVLFALLAVPLALRVEQTRSLAMPALQGVILLFLFLLLREYGPNLAPGGDAVAVVPWAVVGLFMAYGTWRLVRVPQ